MSYWSSRRSSRYEDQWPAYVSVADRRANAEKEVAKLLKKGVAVSPVRIEGKKIATTFWGKAWCDNLESYRDYESRLPRGRSYVRNGAVIDLRIAPREVTAMVSGSDIYKIKISIGEVAKPHWTAICDDCSGGIESLVELLQGRLSKGVMERICRQDAGLFPMPADIKFSCSCPDWASMCKHVAAVLYGVGARLDAEPELLFRLRAVDEKDLVADIGKVLPMSKTGPDAGKVLEADDMAALFGLDMAGAEPEGGETPEAAMSALPPPAGMPVEARKKPAPRAKPGAVTANKVVAEPIQTPSARAALAGAKQASKGSRGSGARSDAASVASTTVETRRTVLTRSVSTGTGIGKRTIEATASTKQRSASKVVTATKQTTKTGSAPTGAATGKATIDTVPPTKQVRAAAKRPTATGPASAGGGAETGTPGLATPEMTPSDNRGGRTVRLGSSASRAGAGAKPALQSGTRPTASVVSHEEPVKWREPAAIEPVAKRRDHLKTAAKVKAAAE